MIEILWFIISRRIRFFVNIFWLIKHLPCNKFLWITTTHKATRRSQSLALGQIWAHLPWHSKIGSDTSFSTAQSSQIKKQITLRRWQYCQNTFVWAYRHTWSTIQFSNCVFWLQLQFCNCVLSTHVIYNTILQLYLLISKIHY